MVHYGQQWLPKDNIKVYILDIVNNLFYKAMDALHLLLYQIHQTPPAAFVGFRTVYSQAMDALHLLLYHIHQTPPAAFVGFRTVYSQAMDALHLPLYQFHQSPTIGVPFYCMLMDFGGFGMGFGGFGR